MMPAKPRHLTADNAARFQDAHLVEVYHHRLPYPPAVYDRLLALLAGLPRRVLDVGTGTGDLSRGLVESVERVDAIDVSEAMIARGQMLPNGQHPHLHWILGQLETTHLKGPYGLIIGGDSIHWMDWEIIFPLFREVLHPEGYVVIIERNDLPTAWEDGLRKLIKTYGVRYDFEPYNLIVELEKRQVFQVVGRETPTGNSFQSVKDYIASYHSRSSLSPAVMTAEAVQEFDGKLRALVEPYAQDGMLEVQTEGIIIWGRPL